MSGPRRCPPHRLSARRSVAALVLLCLPVSCALIAPSSDELASETRPCPTGTKDCSGSCVSLDDPATGCALPTCGPCELPNAQAACDAGACVVDVCVNGWADCDGEPADGCEIALPSGVDGCECQALRFIDEYGMLVVDTSQAEPLSLGDADFTVEAWLMVPAAPGPANSPIFTTGSREGPGAPLPLPYFSLSVDSTFLYCRATGAGLDISGTQLAVDQEIRPNRWTHLACLRHGDRLLAYVDGVEVARVSYPAIPEIEMTAPFIGSDIGGSMVDLRLGPMRVSRTARYQGNFEPATHWTVDDDTLLQFLVFSPYQQLTSLVGRVKDESGEDLYAIANGGVRRSEQTPCDDAE